MISKELIKKAVLLALALIMLFAIISFYMGFKIGPPEGPLAFLANIMSTFFGNII
ncbi:MAG: hypothetical protein ABIE55_04505 [Candidatus Aenigmatarchaeota archaeon]